MVFIGHARMSHWVEWGRLEDDSRGICTMLFFAITRLGNEAVVVFFVLSGYLVGGRLVKKADTGTLDLNRYWIDRATRIYIPLGLAWIISGCAAWDSNQPVGVWQWVGNAFGLQGIVCDPFAGNRPLWSLSYEIWFYVMAGSIAGIISKPVPSWRLGIALLLSIIVFTVLEPVFLLIWGLGAFAYIIQSKLNHFAVLIMGTIAFFTGCVLAQTVSGSDSVAIEFFGLTSITSWAILAIGLSLSLPRLTTYAPASNTLKKIDRLGSKLAGPSYTLYLVHYPLLLILENHIFTERFTNVNVASLTQFSLKIGTCYILSTGLYYVAERHTKTIRISAYRTWSSKQNGAEQLVNSGLSKP